MKKFTTCIAAPVQWLVARKPAMKGGVVQGNATPVTFATNPKYIAQYVTADEINGAKINGMIKTGFITIGSPNKIGSLILKKAGPIANLPISLSC